MGLSLKSNYEKKNPFLVLTSGKFLEALGIGIGTGSIFCLSFSLTNRVEQFGNLQESLPQQREFSLFVVFDPSLSVTSRYTKQPVFTVIIYLALIFMDPSS